MKEKNDCRWRTWRIETCFSLRCTNPTVTILFYTCFTFRCNTRQSLWADFVAGKAPWPWWYGSLNKFQLNSSPQISFHFRFFICFTQIATANGHKAVEKELRKQLKVRKPQDTESGTVLIGLGVVVKDKLCSGLNVTGKIVNTVKLG